MKKRGVLFTVATILLFFSIFTITSIYLDVNKDLQSTVTLSGTTDKLRYIEDDVISNIYSDILTIKLNKIIRSDTINISFNQVLLGPGRDYASIVSSYKNFIEGTYSNKNNVDITLTDFGNNFTIEPYDASFEIKGSNLSAITMPLPINYIESILVNVKVNAQNNSICEAPSADQAQHPEIRVTFTYNNSGTQGSCTNVVKLDPQENNGATQFYLDTINPTGSIEVKYGQITGIRGDGILAILTNNVTANVTQLDLEYEDVGGIVRLKGGNITINSAIGNITKQNQIILAEE